MNNGQRFVTASRRTLLRNALCAALLAVSAIGAYQGTHAKAAGRVEHTVRVADSQWGNGVVRRVEGRIQAVTGRWGEALHGKARTAA